MIDYYKAPSRFKKFIKFFDKRYFVCFGFLIMLSIINLGVLIAESYIETTYNMGYYFLGFVLLYFLFFIVLTFNSKRI